MISSYLFIVKIPNHGIGATESIKCNILNIKQIMFIPIDIFATYCLHNIQIMKS